jgi:hypothetical protein
MNHYEFKTNMTRLDLIEFHKDKKLIILRSNREYFNEWSQNKLIFPRLVELGFDPKNFTFSQMMFPFYNRLFKLSPYLQPKYSEFLKKAKPSGETKLICIQIRVGGYAMNDYIEPIRSTPEDAKLMWDFIKNNFIDKLRESSTDYRIFLTTDSQKIQDDAKKSMGTY